MPQPNSKWILPTCLALAALVAFLWLRRNSSPAINQPPPPISQEDLLARGLHLLDEQEKNAAREYWAPEDRAQKYGHVLDQFWDRLNAVSNRFALLGELPARITLPAFGSAERLPHGIMVLPARTNGPVFHGGNWRDWVAAQSAGGWQIEQVEIRHNQFTPGDGDNATSTCYFSGHLVNPKSELRAILEGDLLLQWSGPALDQLTSIDASALELRLRHGPVPFPLVFHEAVHPTEGYFIDPLIVRDLDRDGQLEIILAAKNRFYRRDPRGQWMAHPLCQEEPRAILTALIQDFDGDGHDDFLCASFGGLQLYPGDDHGRFTIARSVWTAQPRLRFGQVLTAGDIDGDRDLDLFLAQYQPPYHQGQMPTPYFDANDGHPSFLLLNDGQGNFTDATGSSGLAPKRFRRTYSASFADLDSDRDLDLVVVSDFAGVDGWANDGTGKFTSATAQWFPEHHALGMAHQFADFDANGRLDFLMIGMNSPVADRVEHLGLTRPYPIDDDGMRAKVTDGNRLWLSPGNPISVPALTTPITRTGWSWGAAAADLDNDGFPDLYIANGHETRQSVTEYEPHFWLHDIYVGNSQENAIIEAWFQRKFQRTRGQGNSYGGYERNRFFLNRAGTNWTEVAHLFGLALPEDSRNVLAEDLNNDGRLDLIVTTFEIWPRVQQTIRIFENHLENTGHWIAFDAAGLPPGTKIRLQHPPAVAQTITGDSYRSQSSPRLHFGLGPNQLPTSATVQIPGAPPQPLPAPTLNMLNPVPR